jgi:hypothetical protein
MQNYFKQLVSVIVVSSLTASVAFAVEPPDHVTKILADCPDISDHTADKITNYGTYLAGLGAIKVNGDNPSHPLFQGPVLPGSNIPTDLKAAGYDGYKVTYNPATGAVICHFKSTKGYTPFEISYVMKNAMDGVVTSSGDEQIRITIPVGLR